MCRRDKDNYSFEIINCFGGLCLALQKACKIFSKIQSGKIYVNDLPTIHHTLKIFISDSEMQKALKTIDIDGKFMFSLLL